MVRIEQKVYFDIGVGIDIGRESYIIRQRNDFIMLEKEYTLPFIRALLPEGYEIREKEKAE